MLLKLMKYELKSNSKIYFLLYAALMVSGAVVRLITLAHDSISASANAALNTVTATGLVLAYCLYAVVILGVVAMTFLSILQRFYGNLLSREGYLMFTLPVKPSYHILTKLFCSFIWIVSSVAAVLMSACIVAPGDALKAFFEQLKVLISNMTGNSATILVLVIVLVLVSLVMGILTIYAAMALGNLSNRHKVLSSFGAYMAIYFAIQVILVIIILLIRLVMPDIFDRFETVDAIIALLSVIIAAEFALSIAFFVMTNHLLSKRLNLT